MPSGKTHDAITFLLTAPAFAAGYAVTGNAAAAAAAAVSFLFGGLMFGPDLDTLSRQYSRWGPTRLMWFPYRAAFKHRSRWSHGLIFGTLFRVIYFMGAVTLLLYMALVVNAALIGGDLPELSIFANAWGMLGRYARAGVGEYLMIAAFAGMWAGAASHTFTDMAVTYIKTGRVTEFL
ncbi:MAG: metal-binding protein [Acidobacteria bacterium]|nr:metal-binding protein [Acidobacteriota bacterium]